MLSNKQKAAVFAYRTLANQPDDMTEETIEELDRIRDGLLDKYGVEVCALCLEYKSAHSIDEDGLCPACRG